MRWEQTEFLLKGIYLGLLVVIALHEPSWPQLGMVALYTVGGLLVCLAVAAFRKMREGFRIKGRLVGFLLFLILENPGMVYTGLILGLTLGTYTTFKPETDEATPNQDWHLLAPIIGGAVLGMVFWFLRHVRQRKVRIWIGLALAVALVGGAIAFIHFEPDRLDPPQLKMLAIVLLLGIPGFYLLTFASLVEESEIEIAAICAAMGVALWILARDYGPQLSMAAPALPLALYFAYTWYVLPGLRVFKHALRGLSYAMVGQFRPALASLNRALQLDPQHALARETLWHVHRRVDVDELKKDAEALALVNFDLCLERIAWLLLLERPKPEQIQEAVRLIDLVGSQRPALAPVCAYWSTVAALHQGKLDQAQQHLESVLLPPEKDSPQRRSILFQAWQLALVLHPRMRERVGEPLLKDPARRMEAIAAVERRLAVKQQDPDAWDLKRPLYGELTEAAYDAVFPAPRVAPDFDHAYVQQLGLALVDDANTWKRGCEYLRLAARGLGAEGPLILLQIGQVHDKFGDHEGLWRNYQEAVALGRDIGAANLKDKEKLFAAVKQLGEERMKQENLDAALDAFKFYSQYERAGLETYRTLAELFERKGDPWMALHCAEHALSYDATDKDLLARKDRYYFSLQPEDVRKRWNDVYKWFDIDYCLDKARGVLEKHASDLDMLDWGAHLAELAQAAKPDSITARLLRARVRRVRGEIPEAVALLEEIRQNKPEKFAKGEEDSWYLAHRILGDLYLDEKPDQAVMCFNEFRKSERSGADTMYKLGRAYENLGDHARAGKCYENVVAFENHPLYYEARAGLERVRQ